MTRLRHELQRLYLPHGADGLAAAGPQRALMLGLARPADWATLGRVWRSVQADLGLPPPAIAVNGRDGYQLWFSLARPVPVAEAQTFLAGLQALYLAEVAAPRLSRWPAQDGPAPALPPRPCGPEAWAAFVAPDLAPVFADEPLLDTAPGEDGQADVLARLSSIQPADWQAALAALPGTAARAAPATQAIASSDAGATAPEQDPRRFLLHVMNDAGAPLALRIEAAKALLPVFERGPG